MIGVNVGVGKIGAPVTLGGSGVGGTDATVGRPPSGVGVAVSSAGEGGAPVIGGTDGGGLGEPARKGGGTLGVKMPGGSCGESEVGVVLGVGDPVTCRASVVVVVSAGPTNGPSVPGVPVPVA